MRSVQTESGTGPLRRPPSVTATVLTYAVGAVLWILLSDWLLAQAVDDSSWRVWVSVLKGTAFVVATSVLLFVLLRRLARQQLAVLEAESDARQTLARSEALLREREFEFRTLTEQLPAIVYRAALDPQSTTLYVSPRIAELGHTPQEWISRPDAWLKAVHPDDRDRALTELVGQLDRQGEAQVDYRLRDAAGQYRHYRDMARVVPATGGRPSCLQGLMIDITARVESERRLAQMTQRAHAMLALPELAQQLDERSFMQRGLDVLEDLTASSIAFLHFAHEDEQQIELFVWSTRTLAEYCHAAFDRHYPVSRAGIWAEALRRRETAIVNDYAAEATPQGLPEGHAHLGRILTVPVMEAGKVVMLLGVGNKPVDYGEWDAETVQLIANQIWHIVQRRRAQVAADRLARTIEQAWHEVYLFEDGSLRFVDVNRGARENLGYSREDLEVMTPLDIQPAFDRPAFESLLQPLRDERERQVMVSTLHRRRDGSTYPVDIRIEITKDQQPLFVANVMDVSGRRALEAQVRRLAQAVEQSSESILITDLDGRIEYVNRATVAATGYSAQELIGANPRMLQSGRTPQSTYVELWTCLAAGQPWRGTFHNRRKDGIEYTESATITPIRGEDHLVTHYLAVKRDVTDLRRMGAELDRYRDHLETLVEQRTAELAQAKQAAETANAAKSQFLASMSHEIRTPMNGVIGMVDLLRHTALDSKQLQITQTIRESGRALLAIIDDILDFSKIEAARLVIERGSIELAPLIEGVCASLRPLADEKAVRIDCTIAHGLPERVIGDATRLRQVVTNLLGNAVKFSAGLDRPGQVTLRLTRQGEARFRIEVEDNGIGISTEAQGRLFQPFEQGETSTTRRYGGTGLGLAISRRLVELLQGEIHVRSAPGEGACFTVDLPLEADLSAVPKAATPARPTLPALGLGRRVLVVEDNEINQRVIGCQLEMLGFDVDVAVDGLDGLAQFRAGAPVRRHDLVLTDLHMPRMDGYGLAEALRREPAVASVRVPIVALSANALQEEWSRCRAAGMDDYLAKPVEAEQLAEVLSRHLSASPVPRPPSDVARADEQSCAILDPEVLIRLVGHDLKLAARLRGVFLASLEADVTALADAIRRGETRAAVALAHRLKSTSRSMGAGALGALCERLEALARRDDRLGLDAEWSNFLETTRLTREALVDSGHGRP